MNNQATVEKMIDYTFKNAKYFEEAMTAAGAQSSDQVQAEQKGTSTSKCDPNYLAKSCSMIRNGK
jgi:hypothetical protein